MLNTENCNQNTNVLNIPLLRYYLELKINYIIKMNEKNFGISSDLESNNQLDEKFPKRNIAIDY